MTLTAGRYNLHRLGWKSFEDLVVEINGTILGATVTPFRMGADGGRDGFFQGAVSGEYATIAADARKIVFQCKHTASAGDGLKWDDVKDEWPKVQRLASAGDLDVFVIFTNRRVGAEDERLIRGKFETISCVRCVVWGEEWIESHIDGEFRLLRRVPRLFGIGDLSQILSHTVSEQTRLILEERKTEQAVFVPTQSYREAVSAMEANRCVVLVGPPASGKSSIAMNLCMVLGAEIADLEILKIENAEQFTNSWSARDTAKLFWIDDFLGETTLDQNRARPWMGVFEKIKVALSSGCRFIFTCRDYILQDAHGGGSVRREKFDFITSKKVVVRVDNLTPAEKERILYNHIKLGSLPPEIKGSLKMRLGGIARLGGFTPEIARRLGDSKFHKNLKYDEKSIVEFVERPAHFFSDIIHDLSTAEKATIACLLLFGNSLIDPVTVIPLQIRDAYGVDASDVRRALESMKGSLTKLEVIGGNRTWQVYHPSMIDAMHQHLSEHPAMLDVFIAAAPIEVILRDCTTTDTANQLFVPVNLFSQLMTRVKATPFVSSVPSARFVIQQSNEFIRHAMSFFADDLALIMGNGAESFAEHWGLEIYRRILEDLETDFALGKESLEESLEECFWSDHCSEALHHEDYENPLSKDVIRSCVLAYKGHASYTFDRIVSVAIDGSDSADVLFGFEILKGRLCDAAKLVLSDPEHAEMVAYIEPLFEAARGEIEDHIGELDAQIDLEIDAMQERGDFHDRIEPDAGIFSDVDK